VLTDETKFGVEGRGGIAKISGKHRVSAEINFRTTDYDINDLGFSTNTNIINYNSSYSYRYLQPKGFLNNMNLNFNLNHSRRLDPDLYSNFNFNFNSSFVTKEFFAFGGGFETTPFGTNDIYEPRIDGRYVKVPTYYNPSVWISTDYRKKFAVDLNLNRYMYDEKGRSDSRLAFRPQYRFSDKWKLYLNTSLALSRNEQGFVNIQGDNIIFGERDRNTVITSLESQYIFNNKMALNFAFRHYYSEVEYDNFFNLENNGDLTNINSYSQNHNTTYNSWNVDLRYSWWFAPGSQLTLLYRNAIDSYIPVSRQNFTTNFDNLFAEPQLNSLSLRISYFLDYNRIKNVFKPKKVKSISASSNLSDKMERGKRRLN